MARWQRQEIGSIRESEDETKPNYIKITSDITLKKGDSINMETVESRLAGITKALESGKMTEEKFEEVKAIIEKTPKFILCNLVKLTKLED